MAIERTLVIMKPDAVKRDLIQEILEGYLKPLRLAMVDMTFMSARYHKQLDRLVALHYNKDDAWCEKWGIRRRDARGPIWDSEIDGPLPSAIEFGYQVRSQLYASLSTGPLLLYVFEGEDAVNKIRDVIGATDPKDAAPNTIRGDLREKHINLGEDKTRPIYDEVLESIDFASRQNRAVRNLVHASDSVEEAAREIAIWFPNFG